jgi:hypothetical protein
MDMFSGWFIRQPLHILGVTAALLIFAASSRWKRKARVVHLLIAALAWLLYAAWEWWVLTATPEANIRADVLLIWPLLIGLTFWAIWRALRNDRP